ncbi:MAG TPA: WhiB family transcriptional regulator [Pseudonocardiaceae bacterium]
MSTATVPLESGASDELRGGGDVAQLLDPATFEQSALPCRLHDPDLWFAETPAELERAKQFCADCPLKAECLASALARQEPWGVWGGEIFERGAVIPRKRPRGRPRKADLERDRAERTEQGHAERDLNQRGAAA